MGRATKITHAHAFETGSELGWSRFIARTDMVKNHVNTEGQARFVCAIKVIQDESIHVPPSDIGEHLGMLLDSTYEADVSFTVEGETFYAHRAVLAARSPVFKAELFGFISEATMPSITLHEMASTTFRVILRYIYTDTLPGNDELGDDSTEMFKHLIAAADRYALDRLKLMCAQKLWDSVSTETVAPVLALAETYNCPELKDKCARFLADQDQDQDQVEGASLWKLCVISCLGFFLARFFCW